MNDKPFLKIALFCAFLVATTLACATVADLPKIIVTVTPPAAASQPPPSTRPGATARLVPAGTHCPGGDCAKACVSKLSAIPQSSGSSERRPKIAGQGTRITAATPLVTYPISGDQLGAPELSDRVPSQLSSLQNDQRAQQRIWEYFAAIIPPDQRTQLAYYMVATDGKSGMLASVEQFSGPSDAWALVIDPADASRPRDLTFTLLHEFGHLLTLNSAQVRPDEAILLHPDDLKVYEQEAASCPRYFASGGCSLPDSYINQFFEQFWTTLYPEWSLVNAARDEDNYLVLLAHFHRKHPTQFITPYAATSPEEDMAESWSYFVLNPKPADDSVAHRKVLFYYDFPELVDLRNQIISNICTYAAGQ